MLYQTDSARRARRVQPRPEREHVPRGTKRATERRERLLEAARRGRVPKNRRARSEQRQLVMAMAAARRTQANVI